MANIIITSLGSGGDVFPFLQIGDSLKRRGHHVTLLSHCFYQSAAAKAGLDFTALDSPDEYSRFVKDEPLLNSPRGIPQFIRRHSLPKVVRECELIRQRYRFDDTILITRDLFDTAARISAEKLGVPLLGVFFAPSQVATWKLRVELFGNLLAPDIDRLRGQMGLSPVGDWRSWLGYSGRSIALWPDWFANADSNWPSGMLTVGFMADSEAGAGDIPDEVRDILETRDAPILVTGGTGMYLGVEFYRVSAEACRLLNRRGILVTQYDAQVPHGLPECVQRFRYLPFGKLMPRIAAVLHHGGRGTLSCAIAAGAPQLVLAMGADRPDNALRLERLGVAKYLPPPLWKPYRVAAALDELINSSVVRSRCKELASRVRERDATTAACDLIEGALRP